MIILVPCRVGLFEIVIPVRVRMVRMMEVSRLENFEIHVDLKLRKESDNEAQLRDTELINLHLITFIIFLVSDHQSITNGYTTKFGIADKPGLLLPDLRLNEV